MKRLILLAVLVAAPGLLFAQTENVSYLLELNSSNVPNAIGDNSLGGGQVQFRVDRNAGGVATKAYVTYRVNWRFEGQQSVNNLHIHRGVAGTGGRVVIPSGLAPPRMTNPQGAGNFTNVVEIDSADQLAVVEEILADPAGFYVNVHTAANRGGHIRGQLQPRATSLITQLQADNAALSAEVDSLQAQVDEVQDLLARVARRLGLVP